MKKKIFDKLRKIKTSKTVFALSLALALLLSGMKPIEAKADEIIPSYSDIVSGALGYAHVKLNVGRYFDGVNSSQKSLAGKHYLLVFETCEGEYQKKAVVQVRSGTSSNKGKITVRMYYNTENNGETYTVSSVIPKLYVLDKTDGTGTWLSGDTALENGKTYSYYLLNGVNTYIDRLLFDFLDCGGSVPIYYDYDVDKAYGFPSPKVDLVYTPPEVRGNATEAMWNNFVANTKDFIGYHYLTENGATLWKEMRFNHDVYPYWEQDADGTRKLMIYAPYEQTIYMTKDVGRYVEDGIYDYYISTIERTDEHCIQPYAWYTDYQPDTSTPDKVFEVIVLPYFKDGYGVDANAERTLVEVYDSKQDAIDAYNLDYGVEPTPNPNPTIAPEPLPDPLPPTDDSESMGFIDFIKQFENLFNASGNLWKIMYYCFAFLPQQILWCLWSAVQIFLAVMVIKWIRE